MILHVEISLPDGWDVGPETRVRGVDGGEVREPSLGIVGSVRSGRLNWRDSHTFLEVSVDVDDKLIQRALSAPRPVF